MKHLITAVLLLISTQSFAGIVTLSQDAASNTSAILFELMSGEIAYLPEGNYPINNVKVPIDYAILNGAGMPVYNGSGLIGGTVLTGGMIDMNSKKGVQIKNLGIIAMGKDAIRSGTSGNGGDLYCHVENVSTLGNGSKHGLVFTSGNRNTVINFKSFNHAHGLVFRSSDNSATGVYVMNPSHTVLTIKAVSATGQNAKGNYAQVIGKGGNVTLDARDGYSVHSNIVDAIIDGPNFGSGVLKRTRSNGQTNYGVIVDNDIRIRLN